MEPEQLSPDLERQLASVVSQLPPEMITQRTRANATMDRCQFAITAQDVTILGALMHEDNWSTHSTAKKSTTKTMTALRRYVELWVRGIAIRYSKKLRDVLIEAGCPTLTRQGAKDRRAMEATYSLVCWQMAFQQTEMMEPMKEDFLARPMTAIRQEWGRLGELIVPELRSTTIVDFEGNGGVLMRWYREVMRMKGPGKQTTGGRPSGYHPSSLEGVMKLYKSANEVAEAIVGKKLVLELPLLHIAAAARRKGKVAASTYIEEKVVDSVRAEVQRRRGPAPLLWPPGRLVFPRLVGDTSPATHMAAGAHFYSLGGGIRQQDEEGEEYTLTGDMQASQQLAWAAVQFPTESEKARLFGWDSHYNSLCNVMRETRAVERRQKAEVQKQLSTVRERNKKKKKAAAARDEAMRLKPSHALPRANKLQPGLPPPIRPQPPLQGRSIDLAAPASVYSVSSTASVAYVGRAPLGFASVTDFASGGEGTANSVLAVELESGGLASLLPGSDSSTSEDCRFVSLEEIELDRARVAEGATMSSAGVVHSEVGSMLMGTKPPLVGGLGNGKGKSSSGTGSSSVGTMPTLSSGSGSMDSIQDLMMQNDVLGIFDGMGDDEEQGGSSSRAASADNTTLQRQRAALKRKRQDVRTAVRIVCKRLRDLDEGERQRTLSSLMRAATPDSSTGGNNALHINQQQ